MNERTQRVIKGHRHKDYQHTVDKAFFYRQVVTGQKQSELIYDFKSRETPEQKKQRVKITMNRTKAVAGKVSGFFGGVFRPEKLRFEASHEDPARSAVLSSHVDSYGPDGESLLKWSEGTALFYNDIDPNVFYWVKHSRKDEKDEFEPYIFESENVLDFKIKKGSIKWAVCSEVESVHYMNGKDHKTASVTIYYYFAENGIIEYSIKINEDLFNNGDYYSQFEGSEELREEKIEDDKYLVFEYNTGMSYPPITRIGYAYDKETNKKTYTSFWENATEVYRMFIDDGSCLDISKKLHVFLQKFEYYTPCNYQDKRTNSVCRNGQMSPKKGECPNCHGSGQITHISGQDVVKLRLPTEDEPHVLSPKDMAWYVNLPFDVVEFQQKLIDYYPQLITESIFGVNIDRQNTKEATATEVNNSWDRAQDAMYAFTKSPKRIFEFTVKVVAEIMEAKDGLNLALEYSNEFSLESESYLIDLLGKAKKEGLSPEIIEHLTQRLVLKQNRSNKAFMEVYAAMRKFLPFGGLGEALIMAILPNLNDSDPQKALKLNFKEITEDIVANDKGFLDMEYEDQKKLITEKAMKFSEATILSNSVRNVGDAMIEDIDLDNEEMI